MKKVEIHVAQGALVPALSITGSVAVPEITGKNWRRLNERFYLKEARAIVKAFRVSLPGGTWDRLVSLMILEHATIFAVPHEPRRRRR